LLVSELQQEIGFSCVNVLAVDSIQDDLRQADGACHWMLYFPSASELAVPMERLDRHTVRSTFGSGAPEGSKIVPVVVTCCPTTAAPAKPPKPPPPPPPPCPKQHGCNAAIMQKAIIFVRITRWTGNRAGYSRNSVKYIKIKSVNRSFGHLLGFQSRSPRDSTQLI
jgi:hypothetical protein